MKAAPRRSQFAARSIQVVSAGKNSSVSQNILEDVKHAPVVCEARSRPCPSTGIRGRLKHLLDLMDGKRLKPSFSGYASLLQDCSNVKALAEGKRIHSHLKQIGYEHHRLLANLLIGMYSKCGSLEDAFAVFQEIRQKNVFTWTTMMGAYAYHRRGKEAFHLFKKMMLEGVKPDKVTFVTILNACCGAEGLVEGRGVHALIEESGYGSDVVVCNALMNMYAKCGSFFDASRVFDEMPQHDVVSWNTMIAVCAQYLPGRRSFYLFQKMQQEGMQPNKVTFVNVLEACICQATLEEGKRIHKQIVERGFEADAVVGTAIVNMYRKCGRLQDALQVFNNLPSRDLISWNAMIAAFAQHGSGAKAIELFVEMHLHGVKPDKITFVSVLNACNHAGLIDEGCRYFFSMSKDYDISPTVEHCRCMVDLLGRSGQLTEAEHFIGTSPFQNDILIWTSLLGSCRLYGDVDRGKRAAERLLALDPTNDAGYVVLANIYAAAERWNDVVKVRETMIAHRIKKEPGFSSIEVKGTVHKFVVGDKSHPQTQEIYSNLMSLTEEIKKAGYVPDIRQVLWEGEGEEKEVLVGYHSEKLALAYGLITTVPGTPLHILKNLRICTDCHSAVKFVSKIVRREIIVRDSQRFHHFENGLCSCGDYW